MSTVKIKKYVNEVESGCSEINQALPLLKQVLNYVEVLQWGLVMNGKNDLDQATALHVLLQSKQGLDTASVVLNQAYSRINKINDHLVLLWEEIENE